jgi:hypothetical protein
VGEVTVVPSVLRGDLMEERPHPLSVCDMLGA